MSKYSKYIDKKGKHPLRWGVYISIGNGVKRYQYTYSHIDGEVTKWPLFPNGGSLPVDKTHEILDLRYAHKLGEFK